MESRPHVPPASGEQQPGSGASAIPLARRLTRPFQEFADGKAASGLLLLGAALLALLWANSPWASSYHHLWETTLTIGTERFGLSMSLHQWINDGLMAVFFFVVGLEIKREILVGELSGLRQAALPIVGALGGMVVPALVYTLITGGTPASSGWGIPMATDIAFAIGIVTLLGDRVPSSLKLFLAALAIVDDIGAVIVIAVFYSAELSLGAIVASLALFTLLLGMNRAGFRHPPAFALIGVLLWVAVLSSGVHATIAGVLLAAAIPARTHIDGADFLDDSRNMLAEFESAGGDDDDVLTNQAQQDAIFSLENIALGAQSPLLRFERQLHSPVAFVIMPLFALANAGVSLRGDLAGALMEPALLGVLFGLLIGKPIGIAGAAWLSMRFGIAEMPGGADMRRLVGVAVLGGIGFTMSLFIANLAFDDAFLLHAAKIGILAGSLLAGIGGWLLLRRASIAVPREVLPA